MGTDDLWACPRCGARFVTRNMSHRYGAYTVGASSRGRRRVSERSKRRIESPRFTKVELLGRSDWIHHLVLRSEAERDDDFLGWMREAYDVGRQAHLTR